MLPVTVMWIQIRQNKTLFEPWLKGLKWNIMIKIRADVACVRAVLSGILHKYQMAEAPSTNGTMT